MPKSANAVINRLEAERDAIPLATVYEVHLWERGINVHGYAVSIHYSKANAERERDNWIIRDKGYSRMVARDGLSLEAERINREIKAEREFLPAANAGIESASRLSPNALNALTSRVQRYDAGLVDCPH